MSTSALALEVVEKSFRDTPVLFQQEYTLVTPIAARFRKKLSHYLENDRTAAYVKALEERWENSPIGENSPRWGQNDTIGRNSGRCEFIKKVTSGPRDHWGTWLHRKLLIDFARWLNPHFAVWCDEQIEELLTRRTLPAHQAPALVTLTIEERYWNALNTALWDEKYTDSGCSLRLDVVTATPQEFANFLSKRVGSRLSAEWIGRSLQAYCRITPRIRCRFNRRERLYTLCRPGHQLPPERFR
jgi:hypothetical protein